MGGFEDDDADVSIEDIKDDIEDDDLTHALVNHLREALGLVPLKKKNVDSNMPNEMGINTLIGDCVICLEPLSSDNTNGNDNDTHDVSSVYNQLSKDFIYKLLACKHTFHILCVRDILSNQDADEYLECPLCKSISGKRVGTQPPDGTMTISKQSQKLPGFESDSQGMIVVRYDFSPGV